MDLRTGCIGARSRRWLIALACCGLTVPSMRANALEFIPREAPGVGLVLEARDCIAPCAKHESQVYAGDAARLDAALASMPEVREVWLNSGGGDSDEGQEIGRVLRKRGAKVVVKAGHQCASACAVAFLGGVIRTVESNGKYIVHARSGMLSIDDQLTRVVMADPEKSLGRFVIEQRASNRQFVRSRLSYIQEMLRGKPNDDQYDTVAAEGLDRLPDYLLMPRFASDVSRVRNEGKIGVQSVLLELERQSMDDAVAHFARNKDRLGTRAGAAVRMMEAMLSTLIIRATVLSQETLVERGFVTPIVSAK